MIKKHHDVFPLCAQRYEHNFKILRTINVDSLEEDPKPSASCT